MKRMVLILLCAILWLGAMAQNSTIIITQSNLGYESQTWFYSGYGNSLQRDKIKRNWDEGRRITSVAYTSNGWFVTMAKNSGYSEQVYYNNYAWPGDWIKEHWAKGYYITDISVGNKEWMVVMSKGTGYVDQLWRSGKWSVVKEKIKEKWNEDFYITKATCNDGEWMVVMSKGCGMSDQSWSRRSTYADIKSVIKEYWDKDYSLTLLNQGEDGVYFAVMSKFADGSEPGQNYVVDPSNPSDYIDKRWEDGHDIVYIGGAGAGNGVGTTIAKTNTTTTTTAPTGGNTVTMPYMGGTMTSTINPDGSGVVVTDIPCIHCNNGRCKMCYGTGTFVHPYLGTAMPCTVCNLGSCRFCMGKGRQRTEKYFAPGEAAAYLQANREVNSGYGGSGSGIGTGSGSGSGSSSVERGIEVIEWQVDYTGKGYADVWCEKCGKWAQPHKHIKKVY